MKKTLLSVLAGLAVISSASAASIKDTCLQNSDKLVWVEKDQACIPVHPCESVFDQRNEKFSAYCNRDFLGHDIPEDYLADSLAQLRLWYKYGILDSHLGRRKKQENGEMYYVAFTLPNGGYTEFAFGRIRPYNDTDPHRLALQKTDYHLAILKAYGLEEVCEVAAEPGRYDCKTSESTCNTFNAGPFISAKYSSGLCNIDFKEE